MKQKKWRPGGFRWSPAEEEGAAIVEVVQPREGSEEEALLLSLPAEAFPSLAMAYLQLISLLLLAMKREKAMKKLKKMNCIVAGELVEEMLCFHCNCCPLSHAVHCLVLQTLVAFLAASAAAAAVAFGSVHAEEFAFLGEAFCIWLAPRPSLSLSC